MQKDLMDAAAFLKDIFETKVKTNGRFSLRAYSRLLGISPGGLSQILSRKKKLSTDRAHEFISKLKLEQKQAEIFLTLVEKDTSQNASRRADLYEKLYDLQQKQNVFNLSLDQFRLLSTWYGFAVWELVCDADPTLSNKDIARRLDLSLAEVDLTLDRLIRLELIEPIDGALKGGRRFKRVTDNLLFSTSIPSEALQSYYKDLSKLLDRAVDVQTPEERVSGGQTFAFDKSQLEQVRKLTNDYLDTLNALASKGKKRDEVYQAVVHFFRLTELEKSKTLSVNGRKKS